MNTVVRLRTPAAKKPTVSRSGRARNKDYRQREYLTESEIDSLQAATGTGRNPIRDRLLILMAFRHRAIGPLVRCGGQTFRRLCRTM